MYIVYVYIQLWLYTHRRTELADAAVTKTHIPWPPRAYILVLGEETINKDTNNEQSVSRLS